MKANFELAFTISLIQILKRRGPTIEPCGTPVETCFIVDLCCQPEQTVCDCSSNSLLVFWLGALHHNKLAYQEECHVAGCRTLSINRCENLLEFCVYPFDPELCQAVPKLLTQLMIFFENHIAEDKTNCLI